MWARWTLREFDLAYDGWRQVNVTDPWERARAISFYAFSPHVKSGTFKAWKDLFSIPGEKVKKKQNRNLVARAMTKEEREEAIELGIKFNGQ